MNKSVVVAILTFFLLASLCSVLPSLPGLISYQLLGGKQSEATAAVLRSTASAQNSANTTAVQDQFASRGQELCRAAYTTKATPLPANSPVGPYIELGTWTCTNAVCPENFTLWPGDLPQATDVRAIMCIKQIGSDLTYYEVSKGGQSMQWRIDWDVRLLRWPDGALLAAQSFAGKKPPSSYVNSWTDTSARDGYEQWVKSLPQ